MRLSDDDLMSRLCNYDPRNPFCADLTAFRDDDEPVPVTGAKGCSCDNCFYGRHHMANELLQLRGACNVSAEVRPTGQDDAADAARWREIARRFDGSKTSASERVLADLGLDPDHAIQPLATIIDRACQDDEARVVPAANAVSTSCVTGANVGYPDA